jgi:hypothetical protein
VRCDRVYPCARCVRLKRPCIPRVRVPGGRGKAKHGGHGEGGDDSGGDGDDNGDDNGDDDNDEEGSPGVDGPSRLKERKRSEESVDFRSGVGSDGGREDSSRRRRLAQEESNGPRQDYRPPGDTGGSGEGGLLRTTGARMGTGASTSHGVAAGGGRLKAVGDGPPAQRMPVHAGAHPRSVPAASAATVASAVFSAVRNVGAAPLNSAPYAFFNGIKMRGGDSTGSGRGSPADQVTNV